MNVLSKDVRRIILEASYRAHVGHIGSSMSVADIIAALYSTVLPGALGNADRPRFILSKGHAALAFYAALHCHHLITEEELKGFCKDGSRLGVHPEPGLVGVDFATGSLGMGLPFATGSALASKMKGYAWHVYALLSDAELNEGSVWEAMQLASQWKLGNLHVIVDNNGQQALGFTKDIANNEACSERWKAFGWDVTELDGHNQFAIENWLLAGQKNREGAPRVLIAKTVGGKGVSFMEHKVEWHYLPLTDDQYTQAMAEVLG